MGKQYWYKMKRPYGPGAQPKGIVQIDDSVDPYGVIAYDRELTKEEINEYELTEYEKK